jgi:hypothetical protein
VKAATELGKSARSDDCRRTTRSIGFGAVIALWAGLGDPDAAALPNPSTHKEGVAAAPSISRSAAPDPSSVLGH